MTTESQNAERLNEALEKPKWAMSERGMTVRHTEEEVETALRYLALNGGKAAVTEEQLLSENIHINRRQLGTWRDQSFPHLYLKLRHDLGREIGKGVAGDALERAKEALEAQQIYTNAAVERVGEVPPEHLSKGALALAQAASQTIEKHQLLEERPTEIVETRDVADLLGTLERLGVAKATNPVIDVEIVDEDDA